MEALHEKDISINKVIFTRVSKREMLDSLHVALADNELKLYNNDIMEELLDLGEDGKALTENDDLVMALAMVVWKMPIRLNMVTRSW